MRVEGDDPMLRRTLIAAGLTIPLVRFDDALALLPPPVRLASRPEIVSRLARARRLYDCGDIARLINGLPDSPSSSRCGPPPTSTQLA